MKPSLHHAALSALPVAVVVLDGQGCLVFSNKGWHSLFERREKPAPLLLGTPYGLLHLMVCGETFGVDAQEHLQAVLSGDLASYDHSYNCGRGEESRSFTMTVAPLFKCTGCVIVYQETSKQQQRDEDIRREANHDPLTGLPNRRLFLLEADKALSLAERSAQTFALLYLDLDGFKAVNDTHGHAVGDEVLRQVAARLKTLARDSDLLARQGGDEFVILLQNVTPEQCLAAAERYRRSLAQPFKIHAVAVKLQGSFGVACYPDAAATMPELLRCADRAMYQAKQAGGGVEVCRRVDAV